MSFNVTFQLVNGTAAHYEFDTKVELDKFIDGVNAALSWPRRTHHGVTVAEVKPPVVVKPAAPVIVEKKEEKPNV